jgi:hypothetical protein
MSGKKFEILESCPENSIYHFFGRFIVVSHFFERYSTYFLENVGDMIGVFLARLLR